MAEKSAGLVDSQSRVTWLLAMLAAVAVFVGMVARFRGLGAWGLGGADEYYLTSSIQNVMRFGFAVWECGGYYLRGLPVQYLAAGLQHLGLSPELAPRSVAAVSGLVVLPAIYLLGRRLGGTAVGLLALTLLAVSVWQVEMARFGRMYAPFQAVFVWYLVCFIRYTVDRHRPALWGMVSLSILGVLMWEGGLLLAAANLLPPLLHHDRGRLSAAQWRYMGGMALLVPPMYGFSRESWRLRFAGDEPALPPDFDAVVATAAGSDSAAAAPELLWRAALMEPAWLLAALIPVALAVWALPWIWRFRDRWMLATGLLMALAAALTHQYLIYVSVLVLMLLLRIVDWRELTNRRAAAFCAASAATVAFWLAFALTAQSWRGDEPLSGISLASALVYQFAGYPNMLDIVGRQLVRTYPILGLSLLALFTAAVCRLIVFPRGALSAERVLVIATAGMMLAVSLGDVSRLEMRYIFFLYPPLMLIAITVLSRAAAAAAPRASVPFVAAAVVLGWFALTEDFRPDHLRRIDAPDITFRYHMPHHLANLYYDRDDPMPAAQWLQENVNHRTDLVVSGPGIDSLNFYYRNFDFVYVAPSDERLYAWSCQRGTVERWSNLPLVYSLEELKARTSSSPRSYIVVDPRRLESLLSDLEELDPRLEWQHEFDLFAIVAIETSPEAERENEAFEDGFDITDTAPLLQ